MTERLKWLWANPDIERTVDGKPVDRNLLIFLNQENAFSYIALFLLNNYGPIGEIENN